MVSKSFGTGSRLARCALGVLALVFSISESFAAQECYHQHEVLAITVTKYNLEEIATGVACEIITGESDFADRVRNAQQLFADQIEPFRRRSEGAYQRLYGAGWKEIYEEDSSFFQSNTKKRILDSWKKSDCERFLSLIKIIERKPNEIWNKIFFDISKNFEKDSSIYLVCK